MISVKLSPRLKTLADNISNGSVVADIGTDHALLPIFLVENEISSEVYACDIGDGPLDRAGTFIRKKLGPDCKKITLMKCDGLEGVPSHCDTIVIAGMGGELIANILSRGYGDRTAKLILQPMTDIDKLRRFLYENDFHIVDETVVKEMEHRYYSIIIAERGRQTYENLDIYASKSLREKRDEISLNFIEKIYRAQRAKIRGMRTSRLTKDEDIRYETAVFKELENYLEEENKI